MSIEKLKYPIGKFELPEIISDAIFREWVSILSIFPSKLKEAVQHLNDEQLNTSYRPGGWTIRQVVHHCADSHMNSLIRLKLALTEEQPVIKPYDENSWAELTDTKEMSVIPSLSILEGVHAKWVFLLNSLKDEERQKTFLHPEQGKTFRIDEVTGMYAWHSMHHLAHITEVIKRHEWK